MRNDIRHRAEKIRNRQFDRLVGRAVDSLPDDILAMLDNVAIVVEQSPSAEQLADGDPDDVLFGLYEGTPITERNGSRSMSVPDKITIFRGPIEAHCESRIEMIEEIQATVIHELAHYFGFDEDEIRNLGWE